MDKYDILIKSLNDKIHTFSDDKSILAMWTTVLMSMFQESGMYELSKCTDYIKSSRGDRIVKGIYFLYTPDMKEGVDDEEEIGKLKEDIVKLCEEILNTTEYKELYNIKKEIKEELS